MTSKRRFSLLGQMPIASHKFLEEFMRKGTKLEITRTPILILQKQVRIFTSLKLTLQSASLKVHLESRPYFFAHLIQTTEILKQQKNSRRLLQAPVWDTTQLV